MNSTAGPPGSALAISPIMPRPCGLLAGQVPLHVICTSLTHRSPPALHDHVRRHDGDGEDERLIPHRDGVTDPDERVRLELVPGDLLEELTGFELLPPEIGEVRRDPCEEDQQEPRDEEPGHDGSRPGHLLVFHGLSQRVPFLLTGPGSQSGSPETGRSITDAPAQNRKSRATSGDTSRA